MALAAPAQAQSARQADAVEVFALADSALADGRLADAEAAYRALLDDPDPVLRREARFRMGLMLADRLHRYREAATQFRAILDEEPRAARVRLELARVRALMGHEGAAMRELMAVDTQALPPEVQRAVRFYTANLASRRAFGGSVEVALAPDSNINHATRAETLGTVLGDFVLDANARARSGTGLSLRGSAMARTGIDARARFLVQISGRMLAYRDGAFNDYEVTVQAGPEYAGANGRLVLGATAGARWYGNALYTTSYGVNAQWQRSLGPRSQMRAEVEIAQTDHRFNAWQSGIGYGVSLGLDRSFSPRLGAGVQVSANRRRARDAAYATTGGGVTAFAWRELGHTTLVARLGHDRLKADAAGFLLPQARSDRRVSGSLAATFRGLRIGTFAPIARVSLERNRSTVALFEYRRLAGEMGITAAF